MAAGDGLVSMTPTSIAHSGTSATINADGGVDFSAVTSLSLNGVFTGDYDNYLIVVNHYVSNTTGNWRLWLRLRSSGTDATATNYAYQRLSADSTTRGANRATSEAQFWLGQSSATQRSGDTIHMYGPALAQPTAARNVDASGANSGMIFDMANTHSLSTSYDGVTLIPETGAQFTGNIHVFGYEE